LELFKLFGSIAVDNEEANRQLQETDEKGKSVATSLGQGAATAAKWGAAVGAGALSIGTAVIGMATKASTSLDVIDKSSQVIGLSREAYQEWEYVLSQSGADISSLEVGMKTLTNAMDDMNRGGSTYAETFEKLGLSAEQIKASSREDMFNAVINSLQNMTNETDKAAIASELLGRSGITLIPLLNSTAESTDELKQKAHDLGMILGDDAIDAGVEFTDTMDTLKRTLGALFVSGLGPLLPTLTGLINELIKIVPPLMNFINPLIEKLMPVVQTLIEKLLPIFMALLDALMPILDPLIDIFIMLLDDALVPLLELLTPMIISMLPIFATLLEALVPILKPILELFFELAQEILPLVMVVFEALLPVIEPILKAISALVSAVMAIIKGDWEGAWNSIKDVFTNVWEGIKAYLSAWWNITKAIFQKMWEGIKGFFTTMWNSITDIFEKVFDGIVKGVKNQIENIKDIFKSIIDFVKNVFTGNWKSAWNNVKDIFSSIWEGIKTAFSAPINWIIRGINKFIEGINKIKIPDWVPLVGGKGFSLSMIPELETGGNITESGMAMVGESGPEILKLPKNAQVVPLTDTGSNKDDYTIVNYTVLDGKVVSKTTSKLQAQSNLDRFRALGVPAY